MIVVEGSYILVTKRKTFKVKPSALIDVQLATTCDDIRVLLSEVAGFCSV